MKRILLSCSVLVAISCKSKATISQTSSEANLLEVSSIALNMDDNAKAKLGVALVRSATASTGVITAYSNDCGQYGPSPLGGGGKSWTPKTWVELANPINGIITVPKEVIIDQATKEHCKPIEEGVLKLVMLPLGMLYKNDAQVNAERPFELLLFPDNKSAAVTSLECRDTTNDYGDVRRLIMCRIPGEDSFHETMSTTLLSSPTLKLNIKFLDR